MCVLKCCLLHCQGTFPLHRGNESPSFPLCAVRARENHSAARFLIAESQTGSADLGSVLRQGYWLCFRYHKRFDPVMVRLETGADIQYQAGAINRSLGRMNFCKRQKDRGRVKDSSHVVQV
jgi:hypothetical protein